MDPEQHRQLVAEFGFDLKNECIGAGKPAYSKIGNAINYSPATISRVFTGKKLPRWGFVDAFLRYCEKPDDEIAEWRERWAELVKLTESEPVDPAAEAVVVTRIGRRPKRPASRQGCRLCGVAVHDAELHRRWHDDHPKARPVRAV